MHDFRSINANNLIKKKIKLRKMIHVRISEILSIDNISQNIKIFILHFFEKIHIEFMPNCSWNCSWNRL